MILGGDGVDALRVERGDDRFLADVAEQGDLGALAVGQRSRSQRQTMISGWMPRLVSSRTLCWVGLVFSSPAAAM